MLSMDCLPKKKKPLRKEITEEQKEEGLMALDKTFQAWGGACSTCSLRYTRRSFSSLPGAQILSDVIFP